MWKLNVRIRRRETGIHVPFPEMLRFCSLPVDLTLPRRELDQEKDLITTPIGEVSEYLEVIHSSFEFPTLRSFGRALQSLKSKTNGALASCQQILHPLVVCSLITGAASHGLGTARKLPLGAALDGER